MKRALRAIFIISLYCCSLGALAGEEKWHVVRSGETLSSIAQQYYSLIYGRQGGLAELLRRNPDLKPPYAIKPGMRVAVAGEQSLPETIETKTFISEAVYTVQPGDTASTIAQRFYPEMHVYPKDGSLALLLKNNPRLKDAGRIYTGQKLRLKIEPSPISKRTVASDDNLIVASVSEPPSEQTMVEPPVPTSSPTVVASNDDVAFSEPSWLSIGIRPGHNSYEQNFDVQRRASKLQSSGLGTLAGGFDAYLAMDSDFSFMLSGSYTKRTIEVRNTKSSAAETKLGTKVFYKISENPKKALQIGVDFDSESIPYFSIPSLSSTAIELKNASLISGGAGLRYSSRSNANTLSSLSLFGGIPLSYAGADADSFQVSSGYRIVLGARHKKFVNEGFFWEIGADIIYQRTEYSQVSPYSSENSLKIFQQILTLGIGISL